MTTETQTAPTSAPARRRATFNSLKVSAIERLTDDAVAITFAVPPELRDAYRFTHGQHITVRSPKVGDEVRRNYSICSPATTGELRIAVKRLPGGAFSGYAFEQLQVGDELEVMTPTGRFFTELDPANEKHYVAIAAGSGITPVLSIIATALKVEPKSRVTLLYGNRTTRSVMFLEELNDLKDRYLDRFQLIHVLSREPQEIDLFTGRIDRDKLETFLSGLLPPESVDEWFLCGPYDMVSAAREVLYGQGVRRDHVHAELFHVGDTPPRPRPAESTAATRTITAVLDGRRSTFELPPDADSVLEAVLQVRSDAPFACRGGVCGTCRAKLVEGTVEMARNFALEDSDLSRGYVLTCQSYPTSDNIVVDYDA